MNKSKITYTKHKESSHGKFGKSMHNYCDRNSYVYHAPAWATIAIISILTIGTVAVIKEGK